MHYKSLIATCLLLTSTNALSKITMQQMREQKQLKENAQRAQYAALRSKNEAERTQKAFEALHQTLKVYKTGETSEVRNFLTNARDIFNDTKTRNGVRKERINIKKDVTKKSNTIKSKEFKDFKRLALASGKLQQSSQNLLSNSEKLRSRGVDDFLEALVKMKKIESADMFQFRKEIAQSMYIELSLAAYQKNIALPRPFLAQVKELNNTF